MVAYWGIVEMGVPNRQKRQRCQEADRYPYLVIRLIPAVYHRLPIHFVPNDRVKPFPHSLTMVEPEPFDADGKLTAQCRKNLVEIVRHQVKKTGHRMCFVLGPREGRPRTFSAKDSDRS